MWTPMPGVTWIAPEPPQMCEICNKERGYVRCNCNFEKEYKKEGVPESMRNFKPCNKLCCRECLELKIMDSPTRGIYLQAFACKDCMKLVSEHL